MRASRAHVLAAHGQSSGAVRWQIEARSFEPFDEARPIDPCQGFAIEQVMAAEVGQQFVVWLHQSLIAIKRM